MPNSNNNNNKTNNCCQQFNNPLYHIFIFLQIINYTHSHAIISNSSPATASAPVATVIYSSNYVATYTTSTAAPFHLENKTKTATATSTIHIAQAAANATTSSSSQTTSTKKATTFISGAASGATFERQKIRTDVIGSPNGFEGISTLDKEVVERLIKQWAPVVWLAPEEEFMPLGVDEFLNHVHPMDKGKTSIPGMPTGDHSKKAFLVTNTHIDELLENENSFIHGRNPNDSPVPIYAVVTLCQKPIKQEPKPYSERPISTKTTTLLQQQLPVMSTRLPYIPVSLDPLEERNSTMRRSSRLYPVFKRVRRKANYMPPALPSNLELSPLEPEYDFITGESSIVESSDDMNEVVPTAVTTTATTAAAASATTDDNKSVFINNFMANVADNVKFTPELKNSINFDDSIPTVAEDKNLRNKVKKNGMMKIMPAFIVTYWMFYPYSQGKSMCTLSLGPLGSIPFPAVYGFCLGRRKDIGSHIGDWEHMTLYFNGQAEPEALYVSAHDAGAYYTYNQLTGSFEYKRQETRKGILQRPNFPKTVTTFDNHPVLFAAKGSHGLWTAPGKHRFVKVARLYDINGFGTPWNTWKAVEISYENLKSYGRSLAPSWLSFKGKWGNPKSKCHPFRRIGLNFCEYTDGPTGIPLKEAHFQCGASYI